MAKKSTVPALSSSNQTELKIVANATPEQLLEAVHEQTVNEAQLRVLVHSARRQLKEMIAALAPELAAADAEGERLGAELNELLKACVPAVELTEAAAQLRAALAVLGVDQPVVTLEPSAFDRKTRETVFKTTIMSEKNAYRTLDGSCRAPMPAAPAEVVAAQDAATARAAQLRARLRTLNLALANSRELEEEARQLLDLQLLATASDGAERTAAIESTVADWISRISHDADQAAALATKALPGS